MKRLLVVTLVLGPLAAGAAGWWWARLSLPPLDGDLRLPGLTGPAEVIVDSYGVPHVYARDPEDAWFAAGVLHARDRLWQMELYRRVTRGRLAEVLGEAALPLDKRFLALDLRRSAAAEWTRLGGAARTALERYAAGVNAVALTLGRSRRPLEMQLLGIAPAEWTPEDSLAIGRLFAWRLSENHQAELVRAAVASKLGADAARQLGGRYPADGPTILGGLRGTERDERQPVNEEPAVPPPASVPPPAAGVPGMAATGAQAGVPRGLEWLDPMARRGNSNGWVVSGARTASGRPLLANDPHLPVELPAIWYELHVVAGGLDVIGVTVPGVPFVIIGHNRRIAWGFTNSGADVQDLVAERVDVGRRRVLVAGTWQAAAVTRVEIPVRGRAAEAFDVWRTPNGPIIAEPSLDWTAPPAWMTPGAGNPPSQPVMAYALRWAAEDADIAEAFEQLNRAADWSSFVAAIDRFEAPSQNVVYADVDGNVGYALSGRVPVRLAGDGTMPMAGGGWAAGGRSRALPRVLNPESGYIVSANNEVDRRLDGLTRDWAAPYRAARIGEALARPGRVTADDMAALQTDVRSLAAARVLAGVQSALDRARAQQAEAIAIEALSELAGWDHVVDARPVVTLYQAFEDALWRRTFVDEMDEPLFRVFYEWAGMERPAGLHAIIDDRQSRWFDDIATVERRESRDDIFILAARDAAERVRVRFGRGRGQAWDRVHALRFAHALSAGGRLWSALFDRGPVPVIGDGTTVMRTSWQRQRPFATWEIASWRQILDVGDWDRSRVVLPAGQSGHRLSRYHFDQNEVWRAGGYRPQPFSRAAVLAARAHRLVLVP